MAAPNRWAVREAAEATFYDLVTKKPRVTLKTLKLTEVTTTGETVYAMGGRGNAKIIGFSGNREAKVTIQDAIFDNEAMAMLTGNLVTTGSKTLQMQEDATVGADGIIKLKHKPVGPVSIYPIVAGALGKEEAITADEAVAGEDGLFPVTSVANRDAGRVRVYYTATVADAKTITVTADQFGGTFRLVCDVVVKDEATSEIKYGQFIAPKAKIEDEFTFNFSPEGDPSVLDIPVEILKDTDSANMWELVLY